MYGRVEISCRVALGDYLYSRKNFLFNNIKLPFKEEFKIIFKCRLFFRKFCLNNICFLIFMSLFLIDFTLKGHQIPHLLDACFFSITCEIQMFIQTRFKPTEFWDKSYVYILIKGLISLIDVSDSFISEATLQPVSRTNTSEHLKVFFVRGNEVLVDGMEDVGGSRVYGGAILSRNPKNVQRWLKVTIKSEWNGKVDAWNVTFCF